MNRSRLIGLLWILPLCAFCAWLAGAQAQERQGAYIGEIEDDDGDQVIVMETDWINMHLMPAIGATAIRFVFRPTQNDILDIVQPKNLFGGGGLLQDDVWEQDWRYQELRGRYYDYKITERGPDEVQVVFETKLDGWVSSGGTSKLLQNLKLRRTVTLRQGTPYFLFDVEFINPDRYAKLPLYWSHNSCRINPPAPDHVRRPSDIGINELPSKYGTEYVRNFNHGWTARVSPERKEGLVYLMDYDYLQFLYNCGTTTEEWIYDNLLVLKDRPVKTHIYVIPTMGLEKVDHATEYFIVQLKPIRDKEGLRLQYKVVSSYEKARKITFLPEIEYDLLAPQPQKATLGAFEVVELGIEPLTREVAFNGASTDPVKIRTTAFVELADGKQVKKTFEYFHVGEYSLGGNFTKDLKTPVARLERAPQRPFIPVPAENLAVNRKDFNVFAILGNHSRLLKIESAVRSIPGAKLEVGYHPGFEIAMAGLTDFPYDYERLFNYRVVIFNNSIFDTARLVGLSILHNYLRRGGGLVYGGGENVFGLTRHNTDHPLNEFVPIADGSTIEKETAQLNSPVKDHPIFQGIDLSNLPYQFYVQKVRFKEKLPAEPRVLLKVGADPLIVEYNPVQGQRTMIVLALPFGDKAANPGKTLLYDWPEWPKLYANIVRYAGEK